MSISNYKLNDLIRMQLVLQCQVFYIWGMCRDLLEAQLGTGAELGVGNNVFDYQGYATQFAHAMTRESWPHLPLVAVIASTLNFTPVLQVVSRH